MTVSVRLARHDDYAALCGLFEQMDFVHEQALPGVFKAPQRPARPPEHVSRLMRNKRGALFVAESDGRVIGTVNVALQEAPDIPIFRQRRFAVIGELVVDQACHRRGVARMLLKKVEEWAEAQGVEEIELSVWEFNEAAMACYQSLGYCTLNRRMHKELR
jgi:ribosomal protein S18 acetylase RimI-like enzyme